MNRSSTFLWIALILIVLLPTAAGRIFLDLASGLMLVLLALPIFLTGIGWIGWRFLKSRIRQCEFCGANIINNSLQCPICGSMMSNKEVNQESSTINNSIPASSIRITPSLVYAYSAHMMKFSVNPHSIRTRRIFRHSPLPASLVP